MLTYLYLYSKILPLIIYDLLRDSSLGFSIFDNSILGESSQLSSIGSS